ncbi:hypothetical protein ANCCEY_13155 [Ancylostoma ceylanicum]|uniref:Uncharacterized protein n=1 Tax=Ancylostoma ceylanicum TaxID=53326 RepID=A0A0D6LD21_9BILA|nr:hypothetical protein ANCCEY_13155 [Ancylostoma ceylanicum]
MNGVSGGWVKLRLPLKYSEENLPEDRSPQTRQKRSGFNIRGDPSHKLYSAMIAQWETEALARQTLVSSPYPECSGEGQVAQPAG